MTDLTDSELAACLKVLQALTRRPELCDVDARLAEVRNHAARLVRAARKEQQRETRTRDRELLDSAGIRSDLPPAPSANAPLLSEPRRCYVCKQPYTRLHFFYDALCPACGDLNHGKRLQTANMNGMVALLTGGRVKIGYHTAVKLLRAGASLIVTTRFPGDAARRYAREDDFDAWGDRLEIHALDLRHLPAVERFASDLTGRLGRLDVVINNAAQTVRRPPAFYRHLIDGERNAALPPAAQKLLAHDVVARSPDRATTGDPVVPGS